jgi:hypothetical protein
MQPDHDLFRPLFSFIAAYVMFHGFILYGQNSEPVCDSRSLCFIR